MLWSLAARAGIPAARSALRFLSRLKKPPKSVTLFRGEPAVPMMSAKETGKYMYGPEAKYGLGPSPLRHGAAGRWFTEKPKFASRFAGYTGFGGRGVIKKVTLSPKELDRKSVV